MDVQKKIPSFLKKILAWRKSRAARIIGRTLAILALLVGFSAAAGGIYAVVKLNELSKKAEAIQLNMSNDKITQSFTVLDANDQPLVDQSARVKYEPSVLTGKDKNVPDLYTKTLVAVEDNSFYTRQTKGYSISGITNALFSTLRSKLGSKAQARGGSTIDQQVVKNLALGASYADKSIDRKIVELIDAHSLAMRYSRNDILTAYMDTLTLAPDTIGVNAAWNVFFGQPFDTEKQTPLYIAQIAFIAGLGQAPTTYTQNFDTAGKSRALTVLSVMKKEKIISEKDYEAAKKAVKTELKINSSAIQNVPKAYQAYLAEVNNELYQYQLPDNATIVVKTYTTKAQLDYLYQIATKQAPDVSNLDNAFIPEGCLTALSVVDTKTGHILGLATNSNNPLTPITSLRSSGSTIKPLLDYIPALEFGKITENSTLNGTAGTYSDGTKYQNYGGQNYGPVSAGFALGLSLNSAAIQTFNMTTAAQKNAVMRPLGIASDIYNPASKDYDQTSAISYNISTLQEASAYSAIGNDGVRVTPTAISSLKVNDKEVPLKGEQSYRAFSSSTAQSIVNMMKNVTTTSGSEPLAAEPQWPDAFVCKSGTSNFPSSAAANAVNYGTPDSWMAATSTGVSVAAWVGTPDMSGNTYIQAYPHNQANNMRVYLLNNAIQYMNQNRDVSPFTFSGERLDHNLADLSTPKLEALPSEDDLTGLQNFNPNIPTVPKDLQTFYDQHKNDQLINPSTVFGAGN